LGTATAAKQEIHDDKVFKKPTEVVRKESQHSLAQRQFYWNLTREAIKRHCDQGDGGPEQLPY